MTQPRRVEPGMHLAVSRRTTRRFHLFTPDRRGTMANIFWYALGYALDGCTGIELYAACLMSTHLHYDIGDTKGEAPRFYQLFHRALALSTKAFRGWTQEVFDKASTAAHEIVTPEALVRAIAYTIANPVAACAVRLAHEWPGATTRPEDIGTLVLRVKRPEHYFRGEMFKDEYTIRFTMPACLVEAYGSKLNAQKAIADAVRTLEDKARADAKARNLFIQGRFRVLAMKHTKRATSFEVFGSTHPKFSAGGNLDAARLAIAKFRAFFASYRMALAAYRDGDRNVCFPYGTWLMRIAHGVPVHPPPSPVAA